MSTSKKLSSEQVKAVLDELPHWTREGEALTREYTFRTFPDAVAFVTRLAFDAEANDHHPDLAISYKRVKVTWSTHSEGGVTQKDAVGARQSDVIAASGCRADAS
jgi:4a-hydroxytetrahydrobiopterin dehydratase